MIKKNNIIYTMNYYEILELDKNCSDEEIKKKYKELAKKYHPDKNNSEEAKEKIRNAKHFLKFRRSPQIKTYFHLMAR